LGSAGVADLDMSVVEGVNEEEDVVAGGKRPLVAFGGPDLVGEFQGRALRVEVGEGFGDTGAFGGFAHRGL
jgi:hypothetical protein